MGLVSKKICLIGDFNVGKTSLIRRFIDREFSDRYLSTVGVKISRKKVEVTSKDRTVQLLIWDLEGSTKYKRVAPSYLQGASGALVVADITRKESMEHLPQHIQTFTNINPQGKAIVALNKSDLTNSELEEKYISYIQTFPEVARAIASYTSSAKTGVNVDEMFLQLATHILDGK
ncbi:Rab family GTPase [Geitlerinema sp. PCC 9228]|jgi:small GTP-binding protein|uniref:Rab family GTPase n=1 Tax=Geitlerinema sp. PCC 9228 TaxID=111611 RepID=UPI000A9E2EC3|nr:Rab family GTPase [Geitlerinema sp. PCC 9228]